MHAGESAQLMSDIALCLNLQGNFTDARDMLKETLSVLSRSPHSATTQATTAMAQSNLAVSLLATGAYPEAMTAVRNALELLSAGAGTALPTKPSLYARAAILMGTGVRVLRAHCYQSAPSRGVHA
jgi:tetratricopeptide (TPR) repeat protein